MAICAFEPLFFTYLLCGSLLKKIWKNMHTKTCKAQSKFYFPVAPNNQLQFNVNRQPDYDLTVKF